MILMPLSEREVRNKYLENLQNRPGKKFFEYWFNHYCYSSLDVTLNGVSAELQNLSPCLYLTQWRS